MRWKTIKFTLNPYRKKSLKSSSKPIQRSEYAKSLFDEGAGFNERKAD